MVQNPTCPVDRKPVTLPLPSIAEPLRQLTESLFGDEISRRSARVAQPPTVEMEAERLRREAEEEALRGKIAQLQRHFRASGVLLDESSVEAVLCVCNGDTTSAIAFLELQGEEPPNFVDVRSVGTGQGAVPTDYMRLPDGLPPLQQSPDAACVLGGITQCFFGEAPLSHHIFMQSNHFAVYSNVLVLCVRRGIDLNSKVKARVLAACWARRDYTFADTLLGVQCRGILDIHEGHADVFGTMDILRALRLLDAGRQVRALQRKIATVHAQTQVGRAADAAAQMAACSLDKSSKTSTGIKEADAANVAEVPPGSRDPGRVIVRYERRIEELQKDSAPCSLSGALAKHLRQMIARIPRSKLEFFALQMPGDPWKEICDLLHINPAQGTSLPWFVAHCFGEQVPVDSIVSICANLNVDNALEIIENHHPPYSFVRLKCPQLSEACRQALVRYTTLDQCLWFYEDLRCADIDTIILGRLRAGERLSMPYGKLMERLMLLRSMSSSGELFTTLLALAEQRLQGMHLSLPPPVVVFGDASYSMDVAIRVSAIMASVLAVLTHAELRFFNSASFSPSSVPQSAAQVLELAGTMRTDGPTAPAAALWEYFSQRRPVKTFIVVTDERENTKYEGTYFPMLFRRYIDEVYPARLVLVSFLEINTKGQMATALEALGIRPLQFTLDGQRPDLTRLDGLMGLIAGTTDTLGQEVVSALQGNGMSEEAARAAVKAAAVETLAPAFTISVDQEDVGIARPKGVVKMRMGGAGARNRGRFGRGRRRR